MAGNIGSNFSGLDVTLTLVYLSDGRTNIMLGDTSGFWGEEIGEDIDPTAGAQKIGKLDFGYEIKDVGSISACISANKPNRGKTALETTLEYEFKFVGLNASIEYTHGKDFAGKSSDEVVVGAVYKF